MVRGRANRTIRLLRGDVPPRFYIVVQIARTCLSSFMQRISEKLKRVFFSNSRRKNLFEFVMEGFQFVKELNM